MADRVFGDNILLILSTCTLGMLEINFYTSNHRSIKCNDKMQTKESAPIVVFASIYALSEIGEIVDSCGKKLLDQYLTFPHWEL